MRITWLIGPASSNNATYFSDENRKVTLAERFFLFDGSTLGGRLFTVGLIEGLKGVKNVNNFQTKIEFCRTLSDKSISGFSWFLGKISTIEKP